MYNIIEMEGGPKQFSSPQEEIEYLKQLEDELYQNALDLKKIKIY